MALTLTPTAFSDSQDSQSRRPLVEILSQNTVADIPFDGQFLTSETTNEQRPNVIYHNSGRLIQIYTFGTVFKFVYTDVDRTQFSFVTIALGTGLTPVEASLCELANGNIGIIYIADYVDGTHKLHRLVLSPTGVAIPGSGDTEIASYSSANVLGSPFVIHLASGLFLLVYTKVDSPNYKIMMRTGTTTNFLTWSAESLISPSGLTTTRKRYNTHLLQIDTGEILLFFDYEDAVSGTLERYNIFYSVSSNDGSSWGAAHAATSYADYGDVGKHPVAVQKETNQVTMAYTEQRGAIQMDDTASGICFSTVNPTDLSIDTVNRKLYVLSTHASAGNKYLYGVLKIDIDTWTIDDCWSAITVPAFNAAFFNSHIWWNRHHGEQYLIPVGIVANENHHVVSVVDGEADTITTYAFEDWSTYSITKNMDVTIPTGPTTKWGYLHYTWIDFASKKLWILFYNSYFLGHSIRVGWIDLTEAINPSDPASLYHWNNVISDNDWTEYELAGDPTLLILPDQDLIVVSFGNTTTGASWPGHLKVYHTATGTIYGDFKHSSNEGFPYHGLQRVAYKNGKLYGDFTYEINLDEADKRGLCEIDIASSAIALHRPSWAIPDPYNDYKLNNICATNDGRLFITTDGYGITIYDIVSDTWTTPFTNTTLPGLTLQTQGYEQYDPILYDEATGLVFTAPKWSVIGDWKGLICFSETGYIRRSYYMTGTYNVGTGLLTFSDAAWIVQGLEDYDLVMALDADDSIYAFWTNQALLELSIKWDKESSLFDLTPYIVRGKEIISKRSIVDLNKLSFSVSHGYLFDPHNISSLWSFVLAKGRKLLLRFGEKISGTSYWQAQGTFIVVGTSLSYQRLEYPVMLVEAEDIRTWWQYATITATPHYETDPKSILLSILMDFGLTLSDIDLPIFDDASTIWHQWIETPLKEIIDQICNRFGYFGRITVDGEFSARKISNLNAIDHIYPDNTKIQNFTPDDSFSDFTNRVTIIGESHNWIDVIYAEEQIKSLTGSTGWWGATESIVVWYSNDRSRTCRNPRLEILKSIKEGSFLMSDGDEYIGGVRPDEKACLVVVQAPDLVGDLIANVAAYIALQVICATSAVVSSRLLSLLCVIPQMLVMYKIMEILGTTGNYQYNVHAQPLGKVRQSFQCTVDDLDSQRGIKAIIEKKVSDPLCFSVDQCQSVATFDMTVVMLQRKRIKLTKIADLRDEEGDTIQVPHPYTGIPIKIFITDIARSMIIPVSESEDGYFQDEIEGWSVVPLKITNATRILPPSSLPEVLPIIFTPDPPETDYSIEVALAHSCISEIIDMTTGKKTGFFGRYDSSSYSPSGIKVIGSDFTIYFIVDPGSSLAGVNINWNVVDLDGNLFSIDVGVFGIGRGTNLGHDFYHTDKDVGRYVPPLSTDLKWLVGMHITTATGTPDSFLVSLWWRAAI